MTDRAARLIDLVHAARDQGLYEDDPSWDEVDDLLRLLRPSKPLRGASLPPDPGGPVGFTCPVCGAHDDELETAIDAEVVEFHPQVELWPGGPVVDNVGAPSEMKVIDRAVSTSVCTHVFKESEWDFGWCRHEVSGREWVTVERKGEVTS